VVIRGIEGGSFSLIIQGLAVTDSLTTASTASEVANALYYASIGLPSNLRECTSYSVTKTLSANDLFLRVQFNVDNSQPLSLLEVFTADLTGKSVCSTMQIVFDESVFY
jgi:hypothetical protein